MGDVRTTIVAASLLAIACGGSEGALDYPDASPPSDAGGNDVGARDAHQGGSDATADAREVDASADAGPDGAADSSASDAPADAADAGGLDAGDAGPPTGATLLVSDPGASRIDLLTTTGTVLHTYPAPVQNVSGVAFDRRLRDGFWVVGTDSGTTIQKIAWSGASLPPLTTQSSHSTLRGLDYLLGATAADDLLVFVHTNVNGIEVAGGTKVPTGADSFSMGFYNNNGFQTGFWGVSFLTFDEAGNVMLGWFTHYPSAAIERWQTASFQTSIPATVTQARGLARTPSGEFWVVDQATHRVVHLSSTGAVLGGFDTPGTQPAGLSYDPGP